MPSSADPPVFLIVAGPNGSGKSSLYRDADIETEGRSVWIINPDELTVRIRAAEYMEEQRISLRQANLASVQRIERWLDASIEAYQTVGVETVLSTDKYRRLVRAAKVRGFEFRLFYVVLDSPDRCIERVALRVRKGGHHVAEDDVRKRYVRSLEQMPWFLEQADQALLYDNSGASPKLVGKKENGVVTLEKDAHPVLVEAIRKALNE